MSFRNHPLGEPITYATRLAQRHSDIGFILAQLRREYGPHGLTREDIVKLRKAEPEPFEPKAYAHMTDQYIRKCDFAEFRETIKADSKLVAKLNKALGLEPPPLPDLPKIRKARYVKPTPDRIPGDYREIVASIADDMGVTAADIVGLGRTAIVMEARLVAYKVLHMRGASLAQIGRWLGGRDHTTVRSGVRTFDREASPRMRRIVREWTEKEKTDDAA